MGDARARIAMRENPYKDMRLYERFELGVEAQLSDAASNTEFPVHIVDVGMGGVQLRSTQPLPPTIPTMLAVALTGHPTLRFSGHVRYSNLNDQDATYVSGFKFTPATLEERVVISDFVRQIFEDQWQSLAS